MILLNYYCRKSWELYSIYKEKKMEIHMRLCSVFKDFKIQNHKTKIIHTRTVFDEHNSCKNKTTTKKPFIVIVCFFFFSQILLPHFNSQPYLWHIWIIDRFIQITIRDTKSSHLRCPKLRILTNLNIHCDMHNVMCWCPNMANLAQINKASSQHTSKSGLCNQNSPF